MKRRASCPTLASLPRECAVCGDLWPARATAAARTTTRSPRARRARRACSASCCESTPTAAPRRCGPRRLRNPCASRSTGPAGDLVIGDVGRAASRRSTGRRLRGAARAPTTAGRASRAGAAHNACSAPGAVPPTLEKTHAGDGYCAIVGGYVVRDPGLPSLAGRYLYGDNCSAPLRSVGRSSSPATRRGHRAVAERPGQLRRGRLRASVRGVGDGGGVYRIQDGAVSPCPAGTANPPASPGCGLEHEGLRHAQRDAPALPAPRAARHGRVQRDDHRAAARGRAHPHGERPDRRPAAHRAPARDQAHERQAAARAAAPPHGAADAADLEPRTSGAVRSASHRVTLRRR